MAKLKPITESLAESLKKAVPAFLDIASPVQAPMVEASAVESKSLPKSAPLPSKLVRASISMKATEQDKVDQILELLKKCRQHRGGVTEAIGIALRLCPLDEAHIGRAWDESRAEDKRTKAHKV